MTNKYQSLFYPLVDEFDRKFFQKLQVAVRDKYGFVGSAEDKTYFFKSLLCFQLNKDYRSPILSVDKHLSMETDLASINRELKELKLEFDVSWMVWKRDKIMAELAQKLNARGVRPIGSNDDFNEFVLRYLVSIWLVDWEGPLYVILNAIGDNEPDLEELNKLLHFWDFTSIFDNYK